jgi:hypothetical protein
MQRKHVFAGDAGFRPETRIEDETSRPFAVMAAQKISQLILF